MEIGGIGREDEKKNSVVRQKVKDLVRWGGSRKNPEER